MNGIVNPRRIDKSACRFYRAVCKNRLMSLRSDKRVGRGTLGAARIDNPSHCRASVFQNSYALMAAHIAGDRPYCGILMIL